MTSIDLILQTKFGIIPRFVEKEDATFILSLRTDSKLCRYLSTTVDDVELQETWIEKYKERERQKHEFYFIFETGNKIQFGVSRIYNFDVASFEVGSWLFSSDSPEGVSILADLYTRDFAFRNFSYMDCCRFEVRKKNKSVVNYHKRFKPTLVREDEYNYYFELSKIDYIKFRNVLVKIYSNGN